MFKRYSEKFITINIFFSTLLHMIFRDFMIFSENLKISIFCRGDYDIIVKNTGEGIQ
jgi:hypothetical protein